MKKLQMFLRMVGKAFKERKSRVAIAFFAIVVGVGIIASLFSVYYDISIKMSEELRVYGANLVLAPDLQAANKEMNIEQLDKIVNKFDKDKLVGYRPNLYGVAKAKAKGILDVKKPVVLVGTWFDQVDQVNPYWKVEGELLANKSVDDEVVIGKEAAKKLGYDVGDTITISVEETGKEEKLIISGIITTGNEADSQIFVNLSLAQELLGKPDKINIAYFSVLGQNLSSKVKKINKTVNGIELETIKKIASSEGKVLNKIKSLMYLVVMIILLSTLLCVSTTMMTIVTERKEEIGLKKALGAENSNIITEFLTEAAILGGIGGLVGYGLGFLGAQAIGQSVFDSYISFRIMIVPASFILAVLVSCIASIIPVRMVVDIDPAVVLKGE
ncbi:MULTISPECIES: ABC transporter permease [unclassified Candidatus Frackibacter]|uniref:ABC transporter permease n=1 Tax=unclassified Candidatus Frackibacter TaxID=2648818 RepID=UPI000886E3A6|nr:MULTISPECIES: FtsX-like permease family protein [unclassified Candidatus Frackibacter]SDC11675.1 putative ABC transport system permease protein [Candidatus Frackibacter sp. WG11]SEM36336.1 putative ABC transport system permease protein [Candidatus Frackibacter sp. WG12]SFL41582.1 putative ABC transport system permease protein [Candidatus Frackibacter sp. WG13]